MSNEQSYRIYYIKEIKIHTDKSNYNYNHSYKYYVKTCVYNFICDSYEGHKVSNNYRKKKFARIRFYL